MRFGRQSHRHEKKSALVTTAQPSAEEQFAYRRRRYAITMGVRIACLILAGAFYHVLWLALTFVGAAVILPWVAVLMANDRLVPKASGFEEYHAQPERALPSSMDDGRTIDQ